MAIRRLTVLGGGLRGTGLAAAMNARWGIRHSSTGPATVADASFWRSLVPKPLRRENRAAWSPKSRQWNPATFFIVMFLFIGSMSIQMITLRNSFDRYMRQSTLRIGQLREVVEKIQNGEQVDVEKALGTGDPEQESGWEEMLREIEREEASRRPQKKNKSKRLQPQENTTDAPQAEGHQAEAEAATPKTSTASFGSFF